MSTHIHYKGKHLGRITLADDGTKKFVFVAEHLGDLETLFRLEDNEVVKVEGVSNMTYEQLRDFHLKDVIGFFPNEEAYLFRNHSKNSLSG